VVVPVRFRAYNVPPPPRTGNEEVDTALGAWAESLSLMQNENLQDQERLPYTIDITNNTTISLTSQAKLMTGTTVQLMGNESIVVHGTISVAGLGPTTGRAFLRLTFPNGTTKRLSSNPIRLIGGGTFSRSWPVDPEFMSGGKMVFELISSVAGAIGSMTDCSLVIDLR
jgi:hypothetical protein